MSDLFQRYTSAQDKRFDASRKIFTREIDLLFTPYSSRKLHANSTLHFFCHVGNLVLHTIMGCISVGMFFKEVFNAPTATLKDSACFYAMLTLSSMMAIMNAALSLLSFITRTSVTLFQGYNKCSDEEKDNEAELQSRTISLGL